MIDMPMWLEQYLPELRCPNCGTKISKDNIIGVGIRGCYEGKNKDKYVTYISIEHACQKCKHVYVFDVSQCNMKAFVYEMMQLYGLFGKSHDETIDILQIEDDVVTDMVQDVFQENMEEDIKNYDEFARERCLEQSRISDDEIKDAKKGLKVSKTWHETMENMGISDQDLERYYQEDEENNNENK